MAFAPKTPEHHSSSSTSSSSSSSSSGGGKRVKTAVIAFASMCSKQVSRVGKKLKPTKPQALLGAHYQQPKAAAAAAAAAASPSPRAAMMIQKPKQLLATISNKAITLVHKNKKMSKPCDRDDDEEEGFDWGDGGVWQRSILMGDKCQPLDFSGVIYYDSHGKQTNELPLRSPRASPLPSYLYNKAQSNC